MLLDEYVFLFPLEVALVTDGAITCSVVTEEVRDVIGGFAADSVVVLITVPAGVFAEMEVATGAMISGFTFDLIVLMSILEVSSAKTFYVLQIEMSKESQPVSPSACT